MTNSELIDLLKAQRRLSHDQWVTLLSTFTDEDRKYAADIACKTAQKRFGKNVFIRGIIEFSNVCRNDCIYCGIRHSNSKLERYRLSKEQILDCCEDGYELGFRTFVLQSGEDAYYTTDIMADIVRTIKNKYPDCAVTLSIGEMSREKYQKLFDSGADRYLLRHETADAEHYSKLHPSYQLWQNRMRCLRDLKEIGFQTGCGFMVGSPYQTVDCIAKDMEFMRDFEPHMIGVGPFIPHCDTPFADKPTGSFELTLFILSLCRIMLPDVLLPATTALGTVNPRGRELGILAGANVVMPNLSPGEVRGKYLLYNNKICTDEQSGQCRHCLEMRLDSIGYKTVVGRGDYGELKND